MTHTIALTRDGLTVDNQPLFLLAGQLHYFRYPRAEWRDLLRKARAGGLNTIDTVIPWNLHEPTEGQFNFTEEADLAAYLDLCAELGLYAIVRPGPYICAEWENGGFPAWLTAKPGVELRVDNPIFLEHTLRWFDTLFPLLVERQATRGGPIILCQIENEHWASGRYGHDMHQATLAQAAIERGMVLPQYTCMGATRDWPEFRNGWSGIAEKLQQTRALWPDNPMIVSELWSGWFDEWGASRHTHKTAARLDAILSQLTAVGASGLSHWMWAGGTNFGYWGGRTVGGDTIFMTTSYDYDAPVTEYGEVTDKFYVARRHHLLMSTLGAQLSRVLADAIPGGPTVIAPAAVAGRGESGAAPYRNVRAGAGAPPTWANFTATFLQNPTLEGQTHQVFFQSPRVHLSIEVEAGSIKPIFSNLPLGATEDGGRRTEDERRTTNDERRTTEDERRRTEDERRTTEDDSVTRSPAHLLPDHGHAYVLHYHTSRILGFWQQEETDVLVLYGKEGETGRLQISINGADAQAEEPIPSNVALSTQHSALSTQHLALSAHYWITDRPTVLCVQAERTLLIVLLTTERAARWWPVGVEGFVCGPDLVVEVSESGNGGVGEWGSGGVGETKQQEDVFRVERSGVMPFYRVLLNGSLHQLDLPFGGHGGAALQHPVTLSPLHPGGHGGAALQLTWETRDVVERTVDEGWQSIAQPISLDELGCDLGYGWYRAQIELAAPQRVTLAAPWLADRARALVGGVDVGCLGVGPNGPRMTLDLDLPAGRSDLRLLLDNLGRFNYGSNTGERKGMLDTLYLDGHQIDLTHGWIALWQEAVFAGEAVAGARPGAVRPDAVDVSIDHFAFQGSSVWLLREFEAREGRAYVLHLTGDRNSGALFVNGVNVARFSRHFGGGFIKADISSLVRPGANVLTLNIQGYAGAPWRATLLEYNPTQALSAAWSFRAGVTPAARVREQGSGVGNALAQPDPRSPIPSPLFYRATFAYDPATHGEGPFRLCLNGLRKGQIWLNGRNVGRYWQIGPQEFYKLPVSWLQAENELLLFEEKGGTVDDVWIAT
jgi:hypothetical protein